MSDRDLIWSMFEILRDVVNKIEPSEANTRRLTEFSQRFHAADAETPAPPHEEAEDDDDDPHEHGTPARSHSAKRRR